MSSSDPAIRIRGATQNNLKNLSLDIPLNSLVVVTGPSGSGKSSLVFDTLYAEGQRRYVETFSPYARQFLDRMDKPRVERIENVPPAIAIDQTNPVRTSRSTVGTMTELTDHFKLLYARAAHLHCKCCGKPVRRDTPASIHASLAGQAAEAGDPRLVVTFPVTVPDNFGEDEIRALLERQGYTRIHAQDGSLLQVVQDRFRLGNADRPRVMEAIESALRVGQGRMAVHALNAGGETAATWKFSADLHCADCDIHYADPTPSLFSFNSALGACETCRGFGRVIGIDWGLVIPDETKTLAGGAIKPWQTASYSECQDDLEKMARLRGIPLTVPWRELSEEQRRWVIEGEPEWKSWERSWPGVWYGVRHFFDWLETKSYKMHVRVLLSRYRAYTECPACHGARLKPEALLWKLGEADDGFAIHELMARPIGKVRDFIGGLRLPAPLDEATELLLGEIKSRLGYLEDVGLGYLTLDRQSRTLSGGEVQRINLTTALGTSLVNTLFVLDEPSIGLHPRDMDRIIQVMQRLRDAGNSLVVVEHDPAVMFAADLLLDIGPGPGERGGEIVAYAAPEEVKRHPDSLTAAYLAGRKRVDAGLSALPVPQDHPRLVLRGATEHNLKGVDAAFPLNRLVVLTGVSGSGKSTLIQDVLYPALQKHFGQPTEAPGAHAGLSGVEAIREVVMVDQSPIGKSSRSNPVSVVGAWDGIRARFAAVPEAQSRGYTAGTFSFNAGSGRCPTCSGSGFEHVEMQFLSDVYLRCPDCDGTRYRPEVREVKLAGKSVSDVLEMTVSEALTFFAGAPDIHAALAPLVDVGLDYLRLGQPVPTLSGGEAQRLKLASHLAEFAARKSPRKKAQPAAATLFLFDEPTTGLHFDDVAKLLRAFRKLVDAGHSLIVIEHNLDVIRAADWLLDLGSEGGDAGGEIVAEGSPAVLARHPSSHTAAALRAYEIALSAPEALLAAEPAVRYRALPPDAIEVRHAREHNLKNITARIPRNRFTVITGMSGSGKSTLAFDILFNEGQRRYLESLNAYARQFVQPAAKPDVDAIFGIPPTVAIEQRTSRGGRKSTVATLTELYHFLRLLYVKLGIQYCPTCDVPVTPQSFEAIAAQVMRDYRGRSIEVLAPLVTNRKGLYTDLAKWARGKGYPQLRVDGEYLPTAKWPRLDRFREHVISLPVGRIPVEADNEAALRKLLDEALVHGKDVVKVLDITDGERPDAVPLTFSTLRACPCCGTSFPEPDPRLFSFNSKHGWCESCYGTGLALGVKKVEDPDALEFAELDTETGEICPACEGSRLNPVARAVRFHDLPIHKLTGLPVSAVADFFRGLRLEGRDAEIARDIVTELASRLDFLQQVGLGYLALDRAAPTLSGGEAQRIRLAAQLGSSLTGVCYILDEPTIGLHPRDNRILLDTLAALEARGNTLVVVEHDEDTIRRADHVIDLGPGAGSRGGEIVAEGTADQLAASPTSVTGRCLRDPLRHPLQPRRPVSEDLPALQVEGAFLHNLKDVTASVLLARLTVVTGVSGSGKSTLARDVLLDGMKACLGHHEEKTAAKPRGRAGKTGRVAKSQAVDNSTPTAVVMEETRAVPGAKAIHGWRQVGRVLEVDQTPIGKTPRSCPATYVGFWDTIRKLFADTNEARMRGWTAARFSFNTGAGRCPVCEGQGMQTVEMSFLPDVKVRCEACGGARFNPETLAVRWLGKSVAEVLAMSVDEALPFFAAHPSISHPLQLLQDVGLGYLTLGQPSPTLSGGEAQRIKLVTELSKVRADGGVLKPEKHTLYVLDEPTVGLHMADVEKLIRVLHRLADAGHTVLVIEHDLDVMAEADWLIDLGPEGGDGGGRIVAAGTPEAVAKTRGSHTGAILKDFLAARRA